MKFAYLCVLFALFICVDIAAQDEAELEQALEMLKEQGMSPEEIRRLENQLRSLRAVEERQQRNQRETREREVQQEAQAKKAERKELEQSVRAKPGQVSLGIGTHRSVLTIRSCVNSPTRDGNLQLLANVVATGTFRGESVVVSINKSHPVGSPQGLFQQMRMWLATIGPDESSNTWEAILKERNNELTMESNQRSQAAMKKYAVNNDMSLDEINANMNAQQKELDKISDDMVAREIKSALSHGAVDLNEGLIEYKSPGLFPSGRGKTPDAFFDLEESQILAVANCN